jgi:uncharacterized protein (DUF1330 family)
MKRQIALASSLAAGIGIGIVLTHGLSAQGAKPKVYYITEFEVIDKAASDAFVKAVTPVLTQHGGKNTGASYGKITKVFGDTPTGIGLTEWDSVDQVQAFIKDAAKLQPERDKGRKSIRSFIVEAGQLP